MECYVSVLSYIYKLHREAEVSGV